MGKYALTYGMGSNMPWELPLGFADTVIGNIAGSVFSTIEFIEQWRRIDPSAVKDYEEMRGRNWRAIVGKALKQYAVQTSRIQQITPPDVSPARWRKQ